MNNLIKPDPHEFKQFWSITSSHTHSSPISMQFDFDLKNYIDDISSNYRCIQLLLECAFHLLNTHILTQSVKYYVNYYSEENDTKALKNELKKLFSEYRKNVSKTGRRLIRDYKATWEIKL
jgi:hypothetical protein